MNMFASRKAEIDRNVRLMHGDIAVVNALSNQAQKCECLAAWTETEACICNQSSVTVPLSRKAVEEARSIFTSIDQFTRLQSRIEESAENSLTLSITVDAESGKIVTRSFYGHHGNYHRQDIEIPKAVLAAVVKKHLLDLAVKLTETGLVSAPTTNAKVKIDD